MTTWILAWHAHVLAENPTQLFQAPYFHPEPDALAYTDHSLALGLLAAPINWGSGNPFLAHNVVFVLSIAFAAFAAFLAAYEITGSRSAAFVAGAAYAFAPYWFGHVINVSHIQILASGWIPMAFLGLHRWFRTRRASALALTTGSFVMAALTSWYQGAFLALALIIGGLTLMIGSPPSKRPVMIAHALLAAAVAAAIIAPFAAPYRRIKEHKRGYTRTLEQVSEISANPASYLASPPENLLYGRLTRRWRAQQGSVETTLFPGVGVVVLAGIGIAARKRNRTERAAVVALLLIAILGVALASGASATGIRRHFPWTVLYEHVVAFRALRAAARSHVLTILGLSMLAGFGARAVMPRLPKGRLALAGLLACVLLLEGTAIPLELGPAPRPPPVYAVVAERPGGVLELPTGFRAGDRWTGPGTRDIDYMLYGVGHWRPLANGASGYTPAGYRRLLAALLDFPDARSWSLLRELGIRTLILHLDELPGTPWRDLERRLRRERGVRLLARSGPILIYGL